MGTLTIESGTASESVVIESSAVEARARVVPVVLAGGAGSRLWPISREHFPKQLIGVLGPHSLLQTTVERMQGFATEHAIAAEPIVICGEGHGFVTLEQLSEKGITARVIVEPMRRDTAPALTLSAAFSLSYEDDPVLVAMPADHAIADVVALRRALAVAIEHALQGSMVALGVLPTRPDPGFGYIQIGATLGDSVYRMDRFVEKPVAEIATQYIASGRYWWNSGIFVVRASVLLDTVKALQPAMYDACVRACERGSNDGVFFRPNPDDFQLSPSGSFDYAVMEQISANTVTPSVVVPLDANWSDLGSWDAVWAALDKDANGNVGRGRVLFESASSCYAHSEGRLVACVGVTNVVAVETEDAVLVLDRSHVQDVKALVTRLKAQSAPEANEHRKVRRPWGHFNSIDHGERFRVKRIVVAPGARLSLQLHNHRAEHWVVVSGTARVTCGEQEFLLGENESTFIPLGVVHRLENPGKIPLEVIEVQSGAYLGEDDIVRFDDAYGRA